VTQSEEVSEPKHPHRVIAERVRELRTARGFTAARLAEELTNVGIKWDRSVVANLENGRRAIVTVEELLGLAYVLDVAPIHLMVPLDSAGWYAVTPDSYDAVNDRVREWIRGTYALPGHTDERKYFSEVPENEWVARPKLGAKERYHQIEQMAADGIGDLRKVDGSTGEVSDYDAASRQWVKREPDGQSSVSEKEPP
jgi:transcriptional regulator with XRE-family HTH domain